VDACYIAYKESTTYGTQWSLATCGWGTVSADSDDVCGDGELGVGLQQRPYARHIDVFREVKVALHRRLGRPALVLVDVRRLYDQPASVQFDDHVLGSVRRTDHQHEVQTTSSRSFVPREHRRVERRLRHLRDCSRWRRTADCS